MLDKKSTMMRTKTMMTKSYSELRQLKTFEERFDYLKLPGSVGYPTFGFDRYLNQRFYGSSEWQQLRQYIIARDLGCDLGVEGYDIHARILIHHMNPISPENLKHSDDLVLDPDNLITTTHGSHNAIHYGSASNLPKLPPDRRPGDTIPWTRGR